MKYQEKLIPGIFKKRYKRFFADVEVNGKVVTAHVPNTGSMKTCLEEGAPCLLSYSSDPKRKLAWTLERMIINGKQIGVNTRLPNAMVYEAWQRQVVPHWKQFDRAQVEVKINDKSRLDLGLWSSKNHPDLEKLKAPFDGLKLHFIEVKNVTLAFDDVAYFPDAVTERGAKHIDELLTLQQQGHTCEMVFVIHRQGILDFDIAKDIDPFYFEKITEAKKSGIKVTALEVLFADDEFYISRILEKPTKK